jgi:hypothetical protein
VTDARPDGVSTGASGWAVVRRGRVSVFVRAGGLEHRPSHLDPLHLDVRYGAHEVVTDPGTFAYNAPPPWRNPLVSAFVHNGPIVNDREPGVRGPRFLWWAWPLAELGPVNEAAGIASLDARLLDPSSRRPIAERRVHVSGDGVRVEDRHCLAAPATVQVTWMLHPSAPSSVDISGLVIRDGRQGPLALQAIRGEEGELAGWFSPTYSVRQSTTALRFRVPEIDDATRLVTHISFGAGR